MRFRQSMIPAAVSLSMGFALGSSVAYGQAAAAPERQDTAADSGAETLAEVVVTGSRLAGVSTFNAPTPVTSLNIEELQVSAPSTLAAALQTLPSIVPGGGPTAGGGTANGGQNFLNLRGLGTDRTLTLVNGHRFVPAGPAGQVDTNLIPQGLVQRVDVVTGGASAAYGSDAVGGVINFILDKKYTGTKVNTSGGRSSHGDNDEIRFTVSQGMGYADNRGHVVLGGELYNSKGLDGSQRSFRRTAKNLTTNPNGGIPSLVTVDDFRTPYTDGGMIVIGAGGTAANNALLEGIQFDSHGNPVPYSYGTVASDIGSPANGQNGGDGLRVSTGQEIIRPLERKTIFAHTDFALTENINLYGEFAFGSSRSPFQSSPTTSTITIQRDNAYLAQSAASLVTRMTALGVTRFTLNRTTREAGVTLNTNLNNTTHYVVGLDGKFASNWNWDVYYEHGQNRNRNYMDPNLITGNLALAADAVVNPATGSIVCRSTLTSPANGCVPFNPFGAGAPSAQALAYVMGRSDFTTVTKQDDVELSITGEAFKLPAGAISLAAGAEYRKVSATTVADAGSNAGIYRLVNQQDFFGKYDIKEAFIEAQFPLLKELPLLRSFDLNVAGRHTTYSTSGGVNTWKVGVNWQLFQDFRVRGTYSHDIRAPNLTDLFATGRQNNITIVDEKTGKTFLSVPNRTFGNTALLPELATTSVYGFVYQPSWLPSFRLAVDHWRVNIDGAIGNVGGQNAVTQCNLSGGASPVCAFVARDAAQNIVGTQTAPFNLTVYQSHGYDIEASYQIGKLNLRALGGYLGRTVTISPLNPVTLDQSGTGSEPNWRGTLSMGYSTGPWSLNLNGRYIGNKVQSRTRVLGVSTDYMFVPHATYLDGQLSYETRLWGGRQSYFLNMQNILDKDPTYDPQTGGATPLPTDTNLYDQVGAMFRIGVKLEL